MTPDEAKAFLQETYNFDTASTQEALGLDLLHLKDAKIYTNRNKHTIS